MGDKPRIELSVVLGNKTQVLLWLSRLAWLVMAVFSIYLFIMDLPVRTEAYRTVCESLNNGCLETSQLNVGEVEALKEMGLTLKAYAGFMIALDILVTIVFIILSVLLLFRTERIMFNLYVSLVFLSLGVGISHYFPTEFPELNVIYHLVNIFGGTYLILFLILPDGKFVPRWSILAALVWFIVGIGSIYFPGSVFDVEVWPIWLGIGSWIGLHICLVFSQVYRYVKVSNQIHRQQMKWYIYSIAIYFIALVLLNFIGQLSVILKIGTELLYAGCFILIPISIAFSIFKYKLWDINIVIHRTILYGLLSLFVILFYVGIVGLISEMLQTEENVLASIITAGIIAVCFHPIKEKLQMLVNRLIYGESDNPYAILSRLNLVLEAVRDTDSVLPNVAKTISHALKIPYVAIQLKEKEGLHTIAEVGEPLPICLNIPLVHQGQEMGSFILSHRSSTEPYRQSDKNLLQDLARQVGILAHSIMLHKDLQLSRQQLVNAREEERRRLRRDLHDGLGPSLASLAIKMDVANSFMEKEPEKSKLLLQEMDIQIKQLLQDIRRIVYSLRPSSLDELGLISAIQELLSQYKTSHIHFTLNAPATQLLLPAALEVAVYRIMQEAITNVIRHSEATTCNIEISLNHTFQLVIRDDGKGLHEKIQYGIGIKSMKERAEELGGSLKIYSQETGGTIILADIPIQ
ncbi:sensor histidine kinase [Fredinandcohnia sp. 179-A 10B2 NHS]|uniref:sensor histidine kinase n=1 Tax=Fredinandcohnia sp. 179-A 10B2 NHS TaxID=3235176 RepID=UPI00399FB55C